MYINHKGWALKTEYKFLGLPKPNSNLSPNNVNHQVSHSTILQPSLLTSFTKDIKEII